MRIEAAKGSGASTFWIGRSRFPPKTDRPTLPEAAGDRGEAANRIIAAAAFEHRSLAMPGRSTEGKAFRRDTHLVWPQHIPPVNLVQVQPSSVTAVPCRSESNAGVVKQTVKSTRYLNGYRIAGVGLRLDGKHKL